MCCCIVYFRHAPVFSTAVNHASCCMPWDRANCGWSPCWGRTSLTSVPEADDKIIIIFTRSFHSLTVTNSSDRKWIVHLLQCFFLYTYDIHVYYDYCIWSILWHEKGFNALPLGITQSESSQGYVIIRMHFVSKSIESWGWLGPPMHRELTSNKKYRFRSDCAECAGWHGLILFADTAWLIFCLYRVITAHAV